MPKISEKSGYLIATPCCHPSLSPSSSASDIWWKDKHPWHHSVLALAFSKVLPTQESRDQTFCCPDQTNQTCTWGTLLAKPSVDRKKCRHQLFQEASKISRSLTLLTSYILTKKWKPKLELKPWCFCCGLFTEPNAKFIPRASHCFWEHIWWRCLRSQETMEYSPTCFSTWRKDHVVRKMFHCFHCRHLTSGIYLKKYCPWIPVATERKPVLNNIHPFHLQCTYKQEWYITRLDYLCLSCCCVKNINMEDTKLYYSLFHHW